MAGAYRVYVLQNPGGRFYIAFTRDLSGRVAQHNSGLSKWTKRRGPWQMVWTSESVSFSEAKNLELRLKRQKGGAGFYRLTGLSRDS
jgi:putative endonuclease